MFRFGVSDMLGQSKHIANAVAIYQSEKFEARVAYNWRSRYLTTYRDWVTGNPIYNSAAGFLDASVKYAVTPSENGADIWISALREGQAVRIEVADNGNGEGSEFAATQSTGVGRANIRDRLTQAYGATHRFETRQNDKGGFSVILEIPYETGDKG